MDLVARGRQLTETMEWVDSERIKRRDLYKHFDKPSGAGERNANVRKGNVGVMGGLPLRGALVSDTQSLVARRQVRCECCEVLVFSELLVLVVDQTTVVSADSTDVVRERPRHMSGSWSPNRHGAKNVSEVSVVSGDQPRVGNRKQHTEWNKK